MSKKKREKKFEIKVLHAELDQLWDAIDELTIRIAKLENPPYVYVPPSINMPIVPGTHWYESPTVAPPSTQPQIWCQTDVDTKPKT